MTRPRSEDIEYDKLRTRYESLQHQWKEREEALHTNILRYKASLLDSFRTMRGQTKGMQRMARRIKRLKEMLVYTEKERVQLDTRVGELLDERLEHIAELASALVRNQPLVDRIESLEALIMAHNEGCRASCGRNNAHNASLKGCESYISRGMQCPDCSRDWLIEFPQSSGEVK